MLIIVFLLLSTGAIAAYARSRGGNPFVWGAISVAGFLLIQFAGGYILGLLHIAADGDSSWLLVAISVGWVGIIAFCTRFLLGAGRPKPSGMWSCPNCKYLNQHYAVVCEPCSRPYASK